MVEEQRRRVENEMSKVIEEIDKSHLRGIQSEMHKCAAACCDNKTYTVQTLHRCIENCGSSFQKAQNYVQEEFVRVQNRLQRCVMDCNDRLKDEVGPNPDQARIDRYAGEFDTCATKCVDSFASNLPALENTMKKVLASKKFE